MLLSHRNRFTIRWVDNLPIHVTRKNLDGKITYVNQTFCELLALPPEELLGKTDYDFFPRELADKYRADDRRVAETGEIFQCVETNRVGDETRYVEVRKTPVRDGTGNTQETQTIFWDVTERERARTALERSNRDLDEFVSVVSHDLHAPIRAVEAYCRLLQKQYTGQLDGEADEYIAQATEGVKRMQRLIDDMRAYARVTRKDKPHQPVNCEAVFADVLANLEVEIKESNATITHDPLPNVSGDATQLMQLLQNLISNAIKYCKERPPEVHISSAPQENAWQFSVRDNGIGIDAKRVKDIFRIFQRLHTDDVEFAGTGIGLATCKRIVQRHRGRIWVESEPGVGSVFYFTVAKTE